MTLITQWIIEYGENFFLILIARRSIIHCSWSLQRPEWAMMMMILPLYNLWQTVWLWTLGLSIYTNERRGAFWHYVSNSNDSWPIILFDCYSIVLLLSYWCSCQALFCSFFYWNICVILAYIPLDCVSEFDIPSVLIGDDCFYPSLRRLLQIYENLKEVIWRLKSIISLFPCLWFSSIWKLAI